MWYLFFASKHLRARWQSLVTIVVGVFLAAIIGANSSLYTDAIAGVGFLQYLKSQATSDTNLYARTSFVPADVSEVSDLWAAYNNTVATTRDETFSSSAWEPEISAGSETQTMFALRDGTELQDIRLRLAYYEGIEESLVITEGRFPAQVDREGAVIPVAIHASAADYLGITVGDMLEIDQRGWESSQIFAVEVVALVRERDENAAFWMAPSPLRREISSTAGYETSLLTTQSAFEYVVTEYIPQPNVQLIWRFIFPQEQFAVSQIDQIHAQIVFFETALDEAVTTVEADASILVRTDLPRVMGAYSGSIDLLNIPTGLILLQLGALVIFFLVVIAALVRRGERREIALLQSRGVYNRQILLLRGIEALFICIVAAFLAPYLARAILALLIPIFTGISGIPLPLNAATFIYSFAAALIAWLVLVATVRPILQQPLILAGGSAARSSAQTWWQRYYVDVVLLVVGVLAFSQFSQDRVLTTSADGTVQADPLLLLTPALLFIAFSSILLRFFPILMSLAANAAARRDGLIGVLSSWQVSREPLHYGRITFLLALAIGIGGFAVTYQATLRGNDVDQATYRVGADLRVLYANQTTPLRIEAMQDELAQQSDIAALSFVNRIALVNTSTGLSSGTSRRSRSRQGGILLGVPAANIDQVAYSRADLDTVIPPTFDEELPQTGRTLPADTTTLRLQVRLDARIALSFNVFADSFINAPTVLTDVLRLQLRLRDEAGTRYLLPLQADTDALEAFLAAEAEQAAQEEESDEDRFAPLNEEELLATQWPDDGWITYTGSIGELINPLPDGLYLEGIVLQSFTGFSTPYEQAQLSIASLQALDAAGTVTTLDWLEPENWSFVNELFTVADAPASTDASGGETALMLRWSETDDPATFGLMLNYLEFTSVTHGRSQDVALNEDEIVGIPVFVSRSFAEANALSVGQRFSLFFDQARPWFEVIDIIDYYPTLYQDTPYIVADQDILTYTLLRRPLAVALPGETWIRLNADTDASAVTDFLSNSENAPYIAETINTEDILQTYRTDTLSLGIIGLLYLSFVIGIVLSAVSLFTYVSLSVQARLPEFAVLRALGLPQRGLLLMIILEQMLILGTSLVLGTLVGFFLSMQVLPPLTISAAGGEVTPPYIVRYDVGALLLFMIFILLVMGFVLLLNILRMHRSTGAQALRFEGE